VENGATGEDIAIADQRFKLARNVLWGAQSQRDSICGRVDDGFGEVSDCDAARAGVGRAEEEVRIAELQLAQIAAGSRHEDVAEAGAAVQQALGQLGSSQAELRRAEAGLDGVSAGAKAEDLRIAGAAVDQARAALESTELAMDDRILRAPYAGQIVSIGAREDERVMPNEPLVWIIDGSGWRVETDDLTELDVVKLSVGDDVVIAFDAIPDVELTGIVDSITGVGESKLGDITYKVVIDPDEQDDRLRWNMTAAVVITP
jgi:multidrug resistance efflux pump